MPDNFPTVLLRHTGRAMCKSHPIAQIHKRLAVICTEFKQDIEARPKIDGHFTF